MHEVISVWNVARAHATHAHAVAELAYPAALLAYNVLPAYEAVHALVFVFKQVHKAPDEVEHRVL
jgi:hypothetical protein